MSDKEGKPWYMSKGVIGGLVTVAIGLAGAFGIEGLAAEKDQIVEIIIGMTTAGAGALAVYGRVKASQKVTLKKQA